MPRWLERLLLGLMVHMRALLHPMDVGAVAIVEQAGRIVLVRHSYKSGWLFPGGAVERGEPPADAVIRELQEEIGLTQSAPPQLLGVFTRRHLWVTNLIVLYRVREAVFVFRPSWEIRAITLADPAALPDGTGPAVRRRLKEMIGEASPAAFW
jgi:8-oxo-dGTP pyrophosphatase MutT (NUDIX family)